MEPSLTHAPPHTPSPPSLPPGGTPGPRPAPPTQSLAMKRQPRSRATLAAMAIATAVLTTLAMAAAATTGRVDGVAPSHDWPPRDRPAQLRRLTVFGADDRRAVSDASLYPYSAVGLLKWSAERNCTASLVGSKYALTAADCVLTRDGSRRVSTLDEPELEVGGGAATTVAHVVKIHRQSEYWTQWTQDTYVLLELDAPLGDSLGKLLLPKADDLDQSEGKTPVQMVGFDGDVATAPSKPELKFAKCTCYFPATFNGPQYMLHHDCDTSVNGSPGSVLLVRYTSMETYIIGIHTNLIGDDAPAVEEDAVLPGYSDTVANRGVLGPFVQRHLEALLANGTKESTEATTSSSGSRAGSLGGSSPVGHTPSSAPSGGADGGDGSRLVGGIPDDDSRLSATTAYMCISFVGCAWACILFIVLRHIRNRK